MRIFQFKARLERTVRLYIWHPLRLLLANASVLVLFFVFIMANYYFPGGAHGATFAPNGEWAFEILPRLATTIAGIPAVMLLLGGAFVVKSLLVVLVAEDMMMIYTRARRSLSDSARRLSLRDVTWFVAAEMATYVVFGVVGLALYVPAYLVWHSCHLDLSWGLFAAFVALYPAFYISLSVASMLAVLPLEARRKVEKIKYFLRRSAVVRIYPFYLVRISIETLLLVVVPLLAIYFLRSPAIALVSASAGLMAPFALLKGSSYEIKLSILEGDADIERIFARHYDERRAETLRK